MHALQNITNRNLRKINGVMYMFMNWKAIL